jgi:UDP-2-acetamido-3-amino-2,3-dideoxy-glucuronate N-acetyltransferase
MTEATIDDLRALRFASFTSDEGTLTVFPDGGGLGLDMPIRRVFAVSGVPAGAVRGNHAHRWCTQAVVCLQGSVSIALDDAQRTTTMKLDAPGSGISIPPGIWNKLTFQGPDTVVIVFCDQPYDEADYLRDRAEFEALKRP